MNIKDIAKICHQANKAYCETQEDDSQKDWDDAPEWQRESAINGVKFHLDNPNAKASASHDAWLQEKLNKGWKWATTKDIDSKEHPCIVPFEELPPGQQAKDYLFKGIVDALRQFIH